MSGTLYIVATPIGNLEDITLRALKVLKEVDFVLCEDTRVTRKLLDHFDIKVNTLSYHQQSGIAKVQEIVNLILEGKNVALVTDAGTPGISDPGNELIDFILAQSQQNGGEKAAQIVIPIPGPSSITSALSICGFDVNHFSFIGFWPKKKVTKLLDKISKEDSAIVFFESPYRILKTLNLLKDQFPKRRIFVGQELTKMHERALRGTIASVISQLEEEAKSLGRVKGELVCILEKDVTRVVLYK